MRVRVHVRVEVETYIDLEIDGDEYAEWLDDGSDSCLPTNENLREFVISGPEAEAIYASGQHILDSYPHERIDVHEIWKAEPLK